MYAATEERNVKWGAPISEGGQAQLAPPLATALMSDQVLKSIRHQELRCCGVFWNSPCSSQCSAEL